MGQVIVLDLEGRRERLAMVTYSKRCYSKTFLPACSQIPGALKIRFSHIDKSGNFEMARFGQTPLSDQIRCCQG